ncbi:hypothetical protein GH808_00850 [Acetobacterium fimetarium]|uniref:Transposase n=1 Tax=Acetobacterium fimetarium TaxID=52691 RepID=A0ABR6WQZ4_9FIRM|nr:hypothetical protein [Acetobacterium fimetarium]MBC3802991.1 hypothetical protein [Acetobacterium fimetarium]
MNAVFEEAKIAGMTLNNLYDWHRCPAVPVLFRKNRQMSGLHKIRIKIAIQNLAESYPAISSFRRWQPARAIMKKMNDVNHQIGD